MCTRAFRVLCTGGLGVSLEGDSGFCAQLHLGSYTRALSVLCKGALVVLCTKALSLELLDQVDRSKDWLVDCDRLGTRVSMELEGRQVCHQRELLLLTLIKGVVLLNPGLQLLPVLCCGW